MCAPDFVQDVDYLVLESTYGNKVHSGVDPEEVLADIINVTANRGGTVIIPCFAVGRTQTLLYHLSELKRCGKIPEIPVFLDSPMAINASELFCRHPLDHRFKADDCQHIFNVATYVRTVEDSKALTVSPFPKIILSASGMATGGRVLHHLKSFIGDPNSAVIFTGFQARGTRGEALVNGADYIRMHGRDFEVKADIHQLDMLSAHADSREILEWLKSYNHGPNQTFLTHGEPEPALALKEKIEEELHWPVTIPEYGQRVELK
jgi:metallo-beta-lactamase family protein